MPKRVRVCVLLSCCALWLCSSAAFAQSSLDVVTYNVKKNTMGSPSQVVSFIKSNAPAPPVIALQEVAKGQLNSYATALANQYPGTMWSHRFLGQYCKYNNSSCYGQNVPYNPAYADDGEGVAILTHLPILGSDSLHILARDTWWEGRAVVQVRVQVASGLEVNVFSFHAPVGSSGSSQHTFVEAFKSWAGGFSGSKLAGGDLNATPNLTPGTTYTRMKNGSYLDAWEEVHGTLAGGATAGNSRIDYWFSKADGAPGITAVSAVVRDTGLSDHRAVFVGYDFGGGGGAPGTWAHADNFNSDTLDTSKWRKDDLFSGTQNPAVTVAPSGGHLNIQLLANAGGTNYNGVRTPGSYDFTGASAQVELVQRASVTAEAYAMFAVGINSNNYYRWYTVFNQLVAQKRTTSGGKVDLLTDTYDPTNDRFLRIRHQEGPADLVLWETAPTANGPWQVRASDSWDRAQIPIGSVMLELKAGTSNAQVDPGTVKWDNFLAGVTGSGPAEELLLEDDFGGTAIDGGKWSNTLMTSPAPNAQVPIQVNDGRLDVGPMLASTSGTHYNGVRSTTVRDLTGAYAYARIAQVPNAGTQFSEVMLTVGPDAGNYYRIFFKGGLLYFQKRTSAAGKIDLGSIAYDAAQHVFWRIRHDAGSDQIVFETAPAQANGEPGAWTERWGPIARDVPLTAVYFELKAGTSGPDANPGLAGYGHFKSARPQ